MTLQSDCIILAFISEQLLYTHQYNDQLFSFKYISSDALHNTFSNETVDEKTSGEFWVLEYGPTEIERNVTGPGEGISLFIKTDFLCMKENELHKNSVLIIQLQLWIFQHLFNLMSC